MFVYHTKSNFELLASLISASFCSFAVVMIGVAQIAPGVALNAVSGRVHWIDKSSYQWTNFGRSRIHVIAKHIGF